MLRSKRRDHQYGRCAATVISNKRRYLASQTFATEKSPTFRPQNVLKSSHPTPTPPIAASHPYPAAAQLMGCTILGTTHGSLVPLRSYLSYNATVYPAL